MSSRFQSRPDRQFGDVLRDHAGLQMDYSFAFILSQSFLNVWYGPGASSRGHDAYSITSTDYPNEAVLRLETIQLTGDGNAFGEFVDEVQGVVILDLSSTFTDLQCCTDAISVELWQPEVIKALSRLVAFVSNRPKKTNLPLSTPRLLDKLPLGLSASLSIGRFMVFVTSPDLAPDEALNISRGVAAHMGICIAYRALRSRHPEGMPDIQPRNQQRLLLSLPAERISHTSAASSTAPTTRALLQVAFWNIALRDAIATRFAADDPYGVGDSSDHLRSLEYFRIQNIETTMIISGTRFNGVARSTVKDNCSVDMSIYSVRGLLHLAHVYNLLLALRTLTSLSPPSTSRKPSTDTPSTLSFDARCSLDSLQLRWDFPILTKMFARVRSLTCQISPELKIEVGWSSIVLAVSILVTHDGIETEEWEELARLPRWNVDIQPQVRPVAIIVKGDNGCLRIPFDYVVADLILDINVTMKSIKHLVRMVSAGHFYDPPTPEAEDAKLVPNIAIQLNNLTLEAADDYIETKLGLIWRTGFDAARIRLEREDAFRAKVATIQLPESPTAASASREVDSDFQFTPNHTVSIADAWERLSHVHAYSWQSAHRKALSQQTEREEAYLLHSGEVSRLRAFSSGS
ncbi:hypothetical protein A0H81_09966 [Grifola frondosa]|uniref:Uncharacterized protein n=1 Tax=Grifola frondosa TaxID=5627 RepID=A0A1C7M145_GRIFR|nr:hypothetical protein A0H81_09966 [Grifola frondosa]